MRLETGAASDVGRVRDGNEDSYLVDDAMGLVAVADGMGGHRGGEVASATAVEALRAAVSAGRPLREAIEEANRAVYDKSLTDTSLRGMGTTVTAGTLAAGGTLLIGHVGDSRAYLLHDGELRRITTDHSLVEELVRDGRLTVDEAAVHPQRSIITRALGVDATVEVDVYSVELVPGDRLLLCSDGLTSMVQPDMIAAELRREPDPTRAATRLVDAANAAGGEDNVTVVVVAVTDEAMPPVSAPVVTNAAKDAHEDAATLDDTAPRLARSRRRDRRRDRRRTRRRPVRRIAIWFLPIVLVFGIALAAVGFYARRSYFVGVDTGRVTIFKGVPGGIAGWDPTIEKRTNLRANDLRSADRAAVRDDKHFSSREDANAYVARLAHTTSTTTSSSTSSTTTSSTTPRSITTLPPTTTPPTTAAPAPAT